MVHAVDRETRDTSRTADDLRGSCLIIGHVRRPDLRASQHEACFQRSLDQSRAQMQCGTKAFDQLLQSSMHTVIMRLSTCGGDSLPRLCLHLDLGFRHLSACEGKLLRRQFRCYICTATWLTGRRQVGERRRGTDLGVCVDKVLRQCDGILLGAASARTLLRDVVHLSMAIVEEITRVTSSNTSCQLTCVVLHQDARVATLA